MSFLSGFSHALAALGIVGGLAAGGLATAAVVNPHKPAPASNLVQAVDTRPLCPGNLQAQSVGLCREPTPSEAKAANDAKPVCSGNLQAQSAGICREAAPQTNPSTPAGPPASGVQGGGSTAPDVNIDVQNNNTNSNSNSSSSNSSSGNGTTSPTAPPVTTPPTAPPVTRGGVETLDPNLGRGDETYCWREDPCLP